MVLDDLARLIETLQGVIRHHGETIGSHESRTRMLLVVPLLNGLGWDTTDPSMVIPDYRVENGKVDFALLGSGQGARGRRPIAFIGVRQLGHAIVEADRTKALIVANLAGVNYVGITNGDRWEFYDASRQSLIADQLSLTISVRYQDAFVCARDLRDAFLRLSEPSTSPTIGRPKLRIQTYYDELNVGPSATLAEIRKAYLQKVKEVHPDLSKRSQANQETARLNQIYGILSDPQLRRDYDAITIAGSPGAADRPSQRRRRHAETASGTDDENRRAQSDHSSHRTGPAKSEKDPSQSAKSRRESTWSKEGPGRRDRNKHSNREKRRKSSDRPGHGTGPSRPARTFSRSKTGPNQSASRSTRVRNRPPYWRSRRRVYFWQKARWLAIRLLVLAALVTAALVGYHAYSGAPLGPAIDMMTEDYRVAAACPTDPGTVFDFVRRPPYSDERSNMSARYTEGWEVQVCDGVLAYQQPAENREVTQPVPVAVPVVTEMPAPNAKATSTPAVRPTVEPTDRGAAATPASQSGTSVTHPSKTATLTPIPTNTPSPTPIPLPPSRHLEEKRYMLELINDERVSAGLNPVVLGDNAAAQLHAEASLENCFGGHWGIDGLKPYMRYSLAGGYQSNGENLSGIAYCIRASEGFRVIGSAEPEIDQAMDGLMGSPDHQSNILYPWHKKVNIGLAWGRYNFHVVQHFEGDYVEYAQLPIIDEGILRMSGTLKNGARFEDRRDLGVLIDYDPPPHKLTPGQIARAYSYAYGATVAGLRPPLDGGWSYPEHEFTLTYRTYLDPYNVPVDVAPPRSYEEAKLISQSVRQLAASQQAEATITGLWITAQKWTVQGKNFSIAADVSDVLEKHGDGVYSLNVWASIGDERVIVSQYSIFHGVTPPDTYNADKFEGG